jgi:hypothetical protein
MDTMSATGAASFGASSGNKKAVHVKVCGQFVGTSFVSLFSSLIANML